MSDKRMATTNFRRTLVTSALPYANGPVHLGHLAGVYLPADIYTRWLRAIGHDAIHISGSDENGVPITISAEAEGVDPQQIADKYHAANEAALRGVGVDFDLYGRTSDPEHHRIAREFFLLLYEAGHFVERESQQFFDPEADRFLPDRYVEGICPNCGYEGARGDQCDNCGKTYDQTELGEPKSKITGATPELRTTKHAFLKLGDFQKRLEEYVESHAEDWRDHVLQQARSWLKEGLTDRAMTRDLSWGIDVPLDGYEGKKLYVWFDAPFGYITNTRRFCAESGDPEGWRRWWLDRSTRYVPFLGKDNIVFHTLIFPATLIGHNEEMVRRHGDDADTYVLPDVVAANEFLNLEGEKFSKSKNWGVDVAEYLERHPVDPLRYTLTALMPETRDTDFTWKELQARTNNELADILGNFVNRTTTFARNYFENRVPALVEGDEQDEVARELSTSLLHYAETDAPRDVVIETLRSSEPLRLGEHDYTLLAELAEAPGRIAANYDRFRFRDALLETMNLARAANKYFNDMEPWKTRKEDPVRTATTINLCLQTVRALGVLIEPVLPNTARQIASIVETRTPAPERAWYGAAELRVPVGSEIGDPGILFEKIPDEVVDEEVARLGSGGDEADDGVAELTLKPEITIDDVMKLDLRTARIVEAEKIRKSKKLLKLRVRIGPEERTIVAGIALGYEPEALVGTTIVVVANLKPATLMGVESQGMLLAANDPEGSSPPILVTFDGAIPHGYEVR